VIDLGPKYLVAKTDPITFTEERVGWYAVNINANDVATMGAQPRWFLATVLLPEGRTTTQLARQVFMDIVRTCRALGIALCGGHTEITAGLPRPIVVGQMLGEAKKTELIRKSNQQPGDLVILTRPIAIEGTAILARAKKSELQKAVGRATVTRAQRFLFSPGISVVRDARLAVRSGVVHAMHDPTEGGLLSGLVEIARAGGVGIRVGAEKIPILAETLAFSRALSFDPLALIASGSLLVVAEPGSVPQLLRAYARKRVPAAVIGEILPRREGLWITRNGRDFPLRPPRRDELARLLEKS
jgi:hydrogenase maturation factor